MRTGSRRTTPAAPAIGLEAKRRRTRRRPADEEQPRPQDEQDAVRNQAGPQDERRAEAGAVSGRRGTHDPHDELLREDHGRSRPSMGHAGASAAGACARGKGSDRTSYEAARYGRMRGSWAAAACAVRGQGRCRRSGRGGRGAEVVAPGVGVLAPGVVVAVVAVAVVAVVLPVAVVEVHVVGGVVCRSMSWSA